MLKKTGVRYLFGYVPNPRAIQLDEEDEIDGIAPQLAALDSHVEKLDYKFYPRRRLVEYKANNETSTNEEVNNVAKRKTELIDSFNKSIEAQMLFWKLQQELKDLKEYRMEVSDLKRFQNVFSDEVWKKIRSLKSDTEKLSEIIKSYEETKKKAKFDKLFSDIDLEGSCYSKSVKKIKDDIAKSGYDGHINIIRFINNTLRKWRLGKVYSIIPREIVDYIDNHIKKDISKTQALKTIEEVLDHCLYYEKGQDLEELKSELKKSLNSCGLSEKESFEIDELILKTSAKNISEVKEKILRAAEILKELNQLEVKSPNVISATLKEVEKTRQERIAIYLQNIINKNITEKLKEGVTVRSIVKKLARAFGKSKRAFKTFDRLRRDPDNFHAMMDLIPVWIMELDDASRIIPLEPAIFDYVIFDESSQCNIAYALPAMFRAKKALFVGDSEQMRDNTIIFKSNRSFDELARGYQIPPELQIKATGEAVQSILDIAEQRGLLAIPLRNHYRSPSELIGFSNESFYRPKGKLIILNSNYLTYKNTNRIMVIRPVQIDWEKETSDRISVSEAGAILEFFKELKSDERYKDKSIGILSFFNAQAAYIRALLEKGGFKEEKDNYKVGIIEGIQGDEKDIIIYSFVIRSPDQKNKYVPLTGEGGDIRADINKGRVNVAFSRARLQTHCFVSIPIEEIPNGIWIKRYLEYVKKNGKIDFYSTELKPLDSDFEKDFYTFVFSNLSKKEYIIQNQVRSCGFRIDFVISNTKNGKRIAIECDGPTHFSNEIDEEYGIYCEDDEERQRILEAAGWNFYRIQYSDWVDEGFNRKLLLDDIIKILS